MRQGIVAAIYYIGDGAAFIDEKILQHDLIGAAPSQYEILQQGDLTYFGGLLVVVDHVVPTIIAVAVGTACAGHDVPLAPALHAFLTAIVANWISAGVRLIPLGHTDSQRILQMLEPAVGETAQRAITSSLDDLGSATFRADLAGIKHETQYTRLFRS